MTTNRTPREDRENFQIALIVGGIAFAIAVGLAVYVKGSQPTADSAQAPVNAPARR